MYTHLQTFGELLLLVLWAKEVSRQQVSFIVCLNFFFISTILGLEKIILNLKKEKLILGGGAIVEFGVRGNKHIRPFQALEIEAC